MKNQSTHNLGKMLGMTVCLCAMLLSTMSCQQASKPKDETPAQACQETLAEEDVFDDTLIGNFTGHGIDTVWTVVKESGDPYCLYTLLLKSTIKGLEETRFDFNTFFGCVFEGDLDGNGTDEIGMAISEGFTYWMSYQVFTVIDNRWQYLTPCCHINSGEADFDSLASPTGQKGYIRLRSVCDIRDEEEGDWLGWAYRDTIVQASYREEMVEEW